MLDMICESLGLIRKKKLKQRLEIMKSVFKEQSRRDANFSDPIELNKKIYLYGYEAGCNAVVDMIYDEYNMKELTITIM